MPISASQLDLLLACASRDGQLVFIETQPRRLGSMSDVDDAGHLGRLRAANRTLPPDKRREKAETRSLAACTSCRVRGLKVRVLVQP